MLTKTERIERLPRSRAWSLQVLDAFEASGYDAAIVSIPNEKTVESVRFALSFTVPHTALRGKVDIFIHEGEVHIQNKASVS